MEITASRADTMKPLFFKAGLPLLLSVAGFFCARIISRRTVNMVTKNSRERLKNQDIVSADSADHDEDQVSISPRLLISVESSFVLCKLRFEEEILGLKNRVEELQNRESDLELKLEKTKFEFLAMTVSAMESEKQKFEKMVFFSQLVNMENGLLQRKLRKLFRKTRNMSRVIREKDLKIERAESEISECRTEIDSRSNLLKKLESELQKKDQVMNTINLAENSIPGTSQDETEGFTKENYNDVLNQLEQLQKDRAAETAEVIYLRWKNACFRHELTRNQEEEQDLENRQRNHLELEPEENLTGNFSLENRNEASELVHQACSRKKKFLQKLKRWVEGHESSKTKLDHRDDRENKCFGRNSVSEEEEVQAGARKSCSSA